MRNLGDRIASNPVVHAVGKMTGCVDPVTGVLDPNSGCGKMKDDFNQAQHLRDYGKAVLDRIRKRGKYKPETT